MNRPGKCQNCQEQVDSRSRHSERVARTVANPCRSSHSLRAAMFSGVYGQVV